MQFSNCIAVQNKWIERKNHIHTWFNTRIYKITFVRWKISSDGLENCHLHLCFKFSYRSKSRLIFVCYVQIFLTVFSHGRWIICICIIMKTMLNCSTQHKIFGLIYINALFVALIHTHTTRFHFNILLTSIATHY